MSAKIERSQSRTGRAKSPASWDVRDLSETELRVLFEACAGNVPCKTQAETLALDALYEQAFEAMKAAGLLNT